jgi:hypothetical protein
MSYSETSNRTALPLDQLRQLAAQVAEQMSAGEITPELRERFILVRTALFQRGIFDPVLVRFDSATAPRASKEDVASQLAAVAQSL